MCGCAKILLVDDAPENIDTLGALLSEYKRTVALSGQRTIELAHKEPKPDLILLDVVMPDMDGYEVCKRLRKSKDTKDIPIIFITSRTEPDSILEGFRIGAQDYVTKPFDAGELLARVKTQLEIVENRKKLQSVNSWLEESVNQRTTELRLANQALQRAKKELENLDTSKSEFLSIISHEIRTPLNGIIGGLSLLKEQEVSEETLEFIGLLDESVQRLESFSISAFSISELKTRGPDALRKAPLDLAAFTREILDARSAMIDEKCLLVDFTQPTGAFDINGDGQFLKKAVLAVLDNAIRHSPVGGTISVRIEQESRHAKLRILDEGQGFGDRWLHKLDFLASENHVDQNPGLGLYLSSLILKNHDGELRYGNNAGKGAYIEFLLPI